MRPEFNQETRGMLYSPAYIIQSIAHFDFISDYTMFWTAARESGITHSHPIMPGTIWILEFLLQAKGKVSFVSFSFRGQKTILCMIYFWKFSKLMLQEDWKICLTHVYWFHIKYYEKKIFLRTKNDFHHPRSCAHLNQRFCSCQGSLLKLCQLGMGIVRHNGESF